MRLNAVAWLVLVGATISTQQRVDEKTVSSRRMDGVLGQVFVGTVLPLSGSSLLTEERQAAADTSSGYQLWAETTNNRGGIQIGDVRIEVVLKVLDSEGDQAKQDAMYEKLVLDGVHFLLGGGANSTRSMQAATRVRPRVCMVSREDQTRWNAQEHPNMFAVHPAHDTVAALSFVRTTREVWGLKRMAVVGIRKQDAGSREQCRTLIAQVAALDVSVVYESWVEAGDPGGMESAMAGASQAGADFLVGCSDGWQDAVAIMQAAKEVLVGGVNVHRQDEQCLQYKADRLCRAHGTVLPQDVEMRINASVKLIYLTQGVADGAFAHAMDGWASRVAGAAMPYLHHEYTDPHLGSTAEVLARWRGRVTWGNGREMPMHAAVAAASGVALTLGIEAAGSLDTLAVAAAIRNVDSETFFGHVRIGADGVNVGLEHLVVQWDCSLDQCTPQSRIPARSPTVVPIQPYRKPCPRNQIWTDGNQLSATILPDPVNPGALPMSYLNPTCTPCLMANIGLYQDMLSDHDNLVYLRDTCPYTFLPVKFGAVAMAYPGDDATQRGLEAGFAWIRSHNLMGVLFSRSETLPILQLEMLPLHLTRIDAQGASVGPGNVAAENGEQFVVDQTAAQERMAHMDVELANTGFGGYIVWNEGVAREMDLGWEASACVGGGVQLKWNDLEICMSPAVRFQGRAIVQLVQHFSFKRCHLVVGPGLAYEQMLEEFERKAGELGVQIESRIMLPSESVENSTLRQQALSQVEELDDCASTVVVLLASRDCAEAIFDRVLDRSAGSAAWGGDRRMVVIGNEAATRAANAPVGMLGLRTVAMAESGEAEAVMGQRGAKRGWGSGVIEDGEEADAPWMDVGVEDAALFVFDSVMVVAEATFVNVFLGKGQSAAVNEEAVMGLALLGTTGELRFQPTKRADGGHMLERVSGRFALVNRGTGGWASIATLNVQDTGTEDTGIVHTVHTALSQWEAHAMEWGIGAHPDGGKPEDACACVVWTKMGPHSDIRRCRWSTQALLVCAAGGLVFLLSVGAVWWSRRERLEEDEIMVRHRMADLRVRLKLRQRDGFVLSTERQGLSSLLPRERPTVIQRSQVEALGRMCLLCDFDQRALDSLSWTLRRGDRPATARTASQDHGTEAFVPTTSAVSLGVHPLEHAHQYKELRAVLLDTSQALLDPSPMYQTDVSLMSPMPSRSRQGGSLSPLLQPSNSRALIPSVRSLRSMVGRATGPSQQQPDGPSSPLGAAHGPSVNCSGSAFGSPMVGTSSMRSSRSARSSIQNLDDPQSPKKTLVGMDSAQVGSTIKERFKFFAQQVAKVQTWQDDDGSLFRELKEGHVQNFMDSLHDECEQLFRRIKQEPGGHDLVRFGTTHAWSNDSAMPTTNSCASPKEQPEGRSSTPIAELVLCPTAGHTINPHRSLTFSGSLPGDNRRRSLVPRQALKSEESDEEPRAEETQIDKSVFRRAALNQDALVAQSLNTAALPASLEPSQDADHIQAADPLQAPQGMRVAENILRQDHERVRAIRLQAEDWREVGHERASSRPSSGGESVGDEEVYISQLHRRAKLLNDEYQRAVHSAIEKNFGSRVSVFRAPVKTKERMREKYQSYRTELSTTEEESKLPLSANILDPVRVSVVCDGPEEVLEVARFLMNEGSGKEGGLPVVRIKNKFALVDASQYDGYRDLMLCVLFEGSFKLSIIGEIQIHDRRLHDMKLLMHKLYRVKRATAAVAV